VQPSDPCCWPPQRPAAKTSATFTSRASAGSAWRSCKPFPNAPGLALPLFRHAHRRKSAGIGRSRRLQAAPPKPPPHDVIVAFLDGDNEQSSVARWRRNACGSTLPEKWDVFWQPHLFP
jgi:hypothetical protein